MTEGKVINGITTIENSWDSTGKPGIANGVGMLTHDQYGRQAELYYENGYMVKQIDRSDSGKVRGICTYKNGIKDGSDILYYENGKKQQEIIYRDGKILKSILWYENGNLKQEMEYGGDINIKNGSEIHYYDDGQKQSESHTVNGKRSGTSFTWDRQGNITSQITYDEFGDVFERK
jgi:antitoxin component YwqK of YwqJK toxin-antitoxin module